MPTFKQAAQAAMVTMAVTAMWAAVGVVALAVVPAALAQTGTGTQETIITAKRLDFDYARFIAVFEGNVVVVDPQVRMEADRMNVVFEGSNAVKSVTATGRVRLWQDDKVATCQRAVYVARAGEVVLRGDAVLTRGNDKVFGDEITFWLFEDRMTSTPGRLVIGPQAGGGPPRSDVLRKPAPGPAASPAAPAAGSAPVRRMPPPAEGSAVEAPPRLSPSPQPSGTRRAP